MLTKFLEVLSVGNKIRPVLGIINANYQRQTDQITGESLTAVSEMI